MSYLKFVKNLLGEASKISLRSFRATQAWNKDDGSLVTHTDYEIQKLIRGEIIQRFPDDGLIAEERNYIKKAKKNNNYWVVDPIDGTASYINGLSTWGISIAILKDLQPFAGYFYMPVTRDFFYIEDGSRVFLNGLPVQMRLSQRLNRESLLLTQSKLHREGIFLKSSYPGRVQGYGSTVTHLCYLASGMADAVLIRRAKIWDLLVGMAMLKRNGGEFRGLYSNESLCMESLVEGDELEEYTLAGKPEVIENYQKQFEGVSALYSKGLCKKSFLASGGTCGHISEYPSIKF